MCLWFIVMWVGVGRHSPPWCNIVCLRYTAPIPRQISSALSSSRTLGFAYLIPTARIFRKIRDLNFRRLHARHFRQTPQHPHICASETTWYVQSESVASMRTINKIMQSSSRRIAAALIRRLVVLPTSPNTYQNRVFFRATNSLRTLPSPSPHL